MIKFTIKFFAAKHKKIIERIGTWDSKCKMFQSKAGNLCITYKDITESEKGEYRTATQHVSISQFVESEE
jgi:hypothetical protein